MLLDILLPGMDGFEILKKIKADERTKRIKVIALSNLNRDSDIEKGKKLGAVRFLTKVSVGLNEIVKEIKAVLAEK